LSKLLIHILLAFFIWAPIKLEAQSAIQIELHGGWVVPNTQEFPQVNKASIAMSIAPTWKMTSDWGRHLKFPEFQFEMGWTSLGNNRSLGHAIYLAPGLQMPLLPSKIKGMQLSFGLGVGYLTKPFSKIDNRENRAIGSRINIAGRIGFSYLLHKSGPWQLDSKFKVLHFSNSGVENPNTGINIPMIGIHLRYKLSEEDYPIQIIHDEKVQYNKSVRPYLKLGVGLKEKGLDGPIYSLPLIGVGLTMRPSLMNRISAGVEFVHDVAIRAFLDHVKSPLSDSFWEYNRLLLTLEHEFVFGELSLATEGGLYLKNHVEKRSAIATKIGVRYTPKLGSWGSPVALGVFSRAYFGEADFLELQLVYRPWSNSRSSIKTNPSSK